MDKAIQKKIDNLVEVLKQTIEGKCAIALAGAHAKGTADASSDIDFYIFAEAAKPYEERKSLIRSAADAGYFPTARYMQKHPRAMSRPTDSSMTCTKTARRK